MQMIHSVTLRALLSVGVVRVRGKMKKPARLWVLPASVSPRSRLNHNESGGSFPRKVPQNALERYMGYLITVLCIGLSRAAFHGCPFSMVRLEHQACHVPSHSSVGSSGALASSHRSETGRGFVLTTPL